MTPQLKTALTGIMVVAIIMLGYMGVWTKWQTLNESKAALTKAQTENEKLKQQERDINNFLADFQQHSDKISLAERALPTKAPNTPVLLDNISNLASDSGLKVSQILINPLGKLESVIVPNEIQSVNLDITVSGDYLQFVEFLKRLEMNLRIMDATNVTVLRQEDGTMDYQMKLQTYYQPK